MCSLFFHWAILQFLIPVISFVIDCKELKLAPTTQIDQFYQFLNLICITCIWLHLLWVNSFANEQNNVKNEINRWKLSINITVIHFTKESNIPGPLLKLDFVFLTKMLEYFGCCHSLLNWVSYKCFYSKKKSCFLKNGWTSGFSIFNSKSDKAALSLIIFILSVEILATAIRRNQNISGILVIQEEIAHIRYIKILTRLWGSLVIFLYFGLIFIVLKSLGIAR